MRDIKFRAWDTEANNWLEDVTYFLHTSGRLITTPPNIILTQYIDLKDKNGKEIYEGDIVKADWHWEQPHAIVWPNDYYYISEYSLDHANIEVISNIFEEPQK
jgi:hypothetical protein